eukprot:TRINITY_DN3024_c0_g1_i1.p1 TRINITY_DN3024_c0_g1~~TRINITY_DN3024_c0_g1_i1.p1  ORF type:complete len:421 (+),score=75.91 TRINITY_DN3024_c0_g1_i1:73-1335(+)
MDHKVILDRFPATIMLKSQVKEVPRSWWIVGSAGIILAFVSVKFYKAIKTAKQKSIIFLGESMETEKLILQNFEQPHMEDLFNRAFCVAMGERMHLNRDVLIQDFIRHQTNYLAYLLAGGLKFLDDKPDQAEEFFSKARANMRPDHPMKILLPNENELAGIYPQELRVVVEEKVWFFEQKGYNRTFLFRLLDGTIAMINPIDLTEASIEDINKLGVVSHIISVTQNHHMYLQQCAKAFPQARTYGPRSFKTTEASLLKLNGYLDDATPVLPNDFYQVTFAGHNFGEVIFVHKATGSAVLGDLAVANGPRFRNRAYLMCFGSLPNEAKPRLTMPSYHLFGVENLSAVKTALKKLTDLPFDRLLLIHGEVIESGGKRQVEHAMSWIAEVTPLELFMLRMRALKEKPWLPTGVRNFIAASKKK